MLQGWLQQEQGLTNRLPTEDRGSGAPAVFNRVKTTDWKLRVIKLKVSNNEFKEWAKEMKAYKNMTNLDLAKAETQVYVFRNFMEEDFWSKCKIVIKSDQAKSNKLPDFYECLRIVEVVFGANTFKYLRREEWYKATRQGTKEPMSVFISRC